MIIRPYNIIMKKASVLEAQRKVSYETKSPIGTPCDSHRKMPFFCRLVQHLVLQIFSTASVTDGWTEKLCAG